MVEIETEIDAADFKRLWTLARETLRKTRYSWTDGRFHWDNRFSSKPTTARPTSRSPRSRCPSMNASRLRSRSAWQPSPGAGTIRRSTFQLKTPRRTRPMPSGCWPKSARRARVMKIAKNRQHQHQGAVQLWGAPGGFKRWTTNNILLVKVETDSGITLG